MRRLVILGGGPAGTMAATKLHKRLHPDEWSFTVFIELTGGAQLLFI